MKESFKKPNLKSRDVEVRYEDGSVYILATERGLKRIISICELLIDESPDIKHQHFESYGILTKESLKCAIRLFSKDEIDNF